MNLGLIFHNISSSISLNVLNIIKKLDIPIIDIKTIVFDKHSDPLSLFPFRGPFHYNAEGYRLVADSLIDLLNNK